MKRIAVPALACAALLVLSACSRTPSRKGFDTPDAAVKALIEAARADGTAQLTQIFGPGSDDLITSNDPVITKRNRDVFVVATKEHWHLEDAGADGKLLIIGNEGWPFPIPLAKTADGWVFDTDAGKEEVIARRIGRNELAAILVCRTYVAAQHLYARQGHDGKPPGLFAAQFHSDAGKQNGLYWPHATGGPRSPLGDLVARAAADQARAGTNEEPSPFHGYYFRILTSQGASAQGGARDYLNDGALSGGFALVAWPSQYDVTGVMTFIVGQDGIVREKDLGPQSDGESRGMRAFDPDASWGAVR
jgi:hypothetical protein